MNRKKISALLLLVLFNEVSSGQIREKSNNNSHDAVEYSNNNNSVEYPKNNVVSKIIFEGLNRVDEDAVKDCVKIHPHGNFSEKDLDDTLKALFKKDFFSHIDFIRRGNTLVIKCEERKVIGKVAFEGNDAAPDEVLKAMIKGRIGEGKLFSMYVIKDLLADFRVLYRELGYHSVVVTPKIIKHGADTVDVVFEIKEGKKTSVQKMIFIGNKFFSDDELKDVMSTKEYKIWRFWDYDSHVHREERIEEDAEAISRLYKNSGFPFVVVTPKAPEMSFDKKSYFCTFIIEEGDRYNIGDVTLKSDVKKISADDFKKYLLTDKGQVYEERLIRAIRARLRSEVILDENPFADVAMDVSFDKEKKTVSVKYTIIEHPKAYIERIEIEGNTRTLDKVIRREFSVHEGDAYNPYKVKMALERLEMTDYFDDVQVTELAGSTPDKKILMVKVKEKESTAQMNFGLTVTDADGLGGFFGISESNLMGTGLELSAEIELMQRQRSATIDVFDPKFLGKNLGAGIEFGINHYNQKNVNKSKLKVASIDPYIFYSITKNLSHRLNFSISKTTKSWWDKDNKKWINNSKDIPKDTETRTVAMRQEYGKYTTGELGSTLTYRQSTNIRDSREGYDVSMRNTVAGVAGSVRFFKNEFFGNYNYPVTDNVMLKASARIGLLHEGRGTRSGHRYHLGSDGMLRGFDWCGVSVKDQYGNSIGGTKYWSITFAARRPLSSSDVGINGVIFLDIGSAWGIKNKNYKELATSNDEDGNPKVRESKSPRASVGVALEWMKCPLGMPLAFIVGFPLKKKPFDKKQILSVDGI